MPLGVTSPAVGDSHTQEVESGRRFRFGRNWLSYADALTEERVERATQSLLQMGESVVPKLRVKLKGPLSLEVRRRIELLLQLNDPSETPEQMRAVRAITALGKMATPASRALLAELAEGLDEVPKTIAARGALLRVSAAGAAPAK